MSLETRVTLVGSPYEPYVSSCFGKEPCPHVGVNCEIVRKVLRLLKVTDIHFLQTDIKHGNLNELLNGSADIACNGEPATENEYQAVNMFQMDGNRLVFLVKEVYSKELEQDLFGAIVSFPLFLSMIAAVVSVVGAHYIMKAFTSEDLLKPWKTSVFVVVTILFGVISNQLSIQLAQPMPPSLPFKSELDLMAKVRSKQCRFVISNLAEEIDEESLIYQFVHPTNAEPTDFQRLSMEAYRANPPFISRSAAKTAKLIRGNECWVAVEWELVTPLWESRFCQLHVVAMEQEFQREFIANIQYRKECKVCRLVETFLKQGSSHDLWMREMWRYAHLNRTNCASEQTASKKPISVYQLKSIFILYLAMVAVATVGVAIEIKLFKRETSSVDVELSAN